MFNIWNLYKTAELHTQTFHLAVSIVDYIMVVN